ncbi:MAG: alpha/beta hydrolase [Synechococcaceae cyanobacterium]|nr:alpha/beta hydrolase [Synechococcaceae cyanobacterium]
MRSRAAIAEQLRALRLERRLGLVLLLGFGAATLVSQSLRGLLLALLAPAELRLLLPWLLAPALLLLPIAGILSLVSQYAFWEGWLEGLPEPASLFPEAPATAGAPPGALPSPRTYVIYLDGIHQYSFDHPPRVAAFLSELEARLTPGVQLLRGLETYTLLPVPLAEERGGAWFWRRLFALQEHHPSPFVRGLTAALVQANNVIKVGISSDRRYGPIRHYELALKIAQCLALAGFHPHHGTSLVLLGYSGGAEMAFGAADYLQRLCPVPLRIVCFCGVFSGNHPLERVEAIGQVVGGGDRVAALGSLAYPGRSPLWPLSRWRRAVRAGRVERRAIPGMTHNGPRGPFCAAHRPRLIEAVLLLIGAEEAAGEAAAAAGGRDGGR